MSVKVVNNSAYIKNAMSNDIGLANRMMLDDIYVKATPNTPMLLGDLRNRVLRTMQSDFKGTIEWPSSYASYQERGMRADGTHVVRNYTTPGTGPHFAEDAVKEVVENAGSYLQKVSTL